MATMLQAFGVMVGVFVEEYEEEGRDVDAEEVVGEVQTSVFPSLPHINWKQNHQQCNFCQRQENPAF